MKPRKTASPVPADAGPSLPAPAAIEQLRGQAGLAAALLKAMGNEDRLMILCTLGEGELSVGEIEARTGIQQPTLSQQLTVLREQGLVSCRRAGRFVFYRVASEQAQALIAVLYRLFCAPGRV